MHLSELGGLRLLHLFYLRVQLRLFLVGFNFGNVSQVIRGKVRKFENVVRAIFADNHRSRAGGIIITLTGQLTAKMLRLRRYPNDFAALSRSKLIKSPPRKARDVIAKTGWMTHLGDNIRSLTHYGSGNHGSRKSAAVR